jgi:hypothetical protein
MPAGDYTIKSIACGITLVKSIDVFFFKIGRAINKKASRRKPI